MFPHLPFIGTSDDFGSLDIAAPDCCYTCLGGRTGIVKQGRYLVSAGPVCLETLSVGVWDSVSMSGGEAYTKEGQAVWTVGLLRQLFTMPNIMVEKIDIGFAAPDEEDVAHPLYGLTYRESVREIFERLEALVIQGRIGSWEVEFLAGNEPVFTTGDYSGQGGARQQIEALLGGEVDDDSDSDFEDFESIMGEDEEPDIVIEIYGPETAAAA